MASHDDRPEAFETFETFETLETPKTLETLETVWRTALWRQCGAALAMLERALLACPDALWTARLWRSSAPTEFPPQFAEFWYLTYHALVWTDLYLAGVSEEAFVPPAPFVPGVLDTRETQPAQPYLRGEVGAYLAAVRQRWRGTLLGLSAAQASRPVQYPWSGGQALSYLELQLYTLRHVQEHAAQLSLFLGQQGIPGEALDWVTTAGTAQDDR
jgi:hypothetical protein